MSDALVGEALVVATVAVAHDRARTRATLPGLPLGFRNNRWRDSEERWMVDGTEHEVRYRLSGQDVCSVSGPLGTTTVRVHGRSRAVCLELDGHVKECLFVGGANDREAFVQIGEALVELSVVERFPDAEGEDEVPGAWHQCLAKCSG